MFLLQVFLMDILKARGDGDRAAVQAATPNMVRIMVDMIVVIITTPARSARLGANSVTQPLNICFESEKREGWREGL